MFVAALIDGEATAKEFHKDSSGLLLPTTRTLHPSPAIRQRSWARSSPCFASSEC